MADGRLAILHRSSFLGTGTARRLRKRRPGAGGTASASWVGWASSWSWVRYHQAMTLTAPDHSTRDPALELAPDSVAADRSGHVPTSAAGTMPGVGLTPGPRVAAVAAVVSTAGEPAPARRPGRGLRLPHRTPPPAPHWAPSTSPARPSPAATATPACRPRSPTTPCAGYVAACAASSAPSLAAPPTSHRRGAAHPRDRDRPHQPQGRPRRRSHPARLRCGPTLAELADLEARPGGLLLHLRAAKTDPERRGDVVGVAHGQHPTTDPSSPSRHGWTGVAPRPDPCSPPCAASAAAARSD